MPEGFAAAEAENEPLVAGRRERQHSRAPMPLAPTSLPSVPKEPGAWRERGRSSSRPAERGLSTLAGAAMPAMPRPPMSRGASQEPQGDEPPQRQVSFQELLHRFREAEERSTHRRQVNTKGRRQLAQDGPAPMSQEQLLAMEEMQRLVKEMARRVEEAERRAEASDLAAAKAEDRFTAEARARHDVELLRAEAAGRVEELELSKLQFQAERESWRQREAELVHRASEGQFQLRDQEARDRSALETRDARIQELEVLLKQAIARGARLGRARTDLEGSKADLERRVSKLKDAAKVKLKREKRRLQAMVAEMQQRAERAEDRLLEYLDASTQGADVLAEAHIRHIIQVSHELAEKVDEQADIIEALRGLLHDHKDFIRREFSSVLQLPSVAEPPSAKTASGCGDVEGPESPLRKCRVGEKRPEPPELAEFMELTAALEAAGGPPPHHAEPSNPAATNDTSSDEFEELFGSRLKPRVQLSAQKNLEVPEAVRKRTGDVFTLGEDDWF